GAYPQMVAAVFDSVGEATGISLNDLMQRPIKPVKRTYKPSKDIEAFPDPLSTRSTGRFSARRFGEEAPSTSESTEDAASSQVEPQNKEVFTKPSEPSTDGGDQ